MFDATCTTLDELATAAAAREVLVGQRPATDVVVTAHHALWRIFEDTDGILGWCAMRVDAALHNIPEAVGFLAAIDVEAEQVVDNLLDGRCLRTNLFGEGPMLAVTHPWADASDSTWHARCPASVATAGNNDVGCGFTGAVTARAFAVNYDGRVDLTRRVLVTCSACDLRFDGRLQAVPLLLTRLCPSCASEVAAPFEAAHLRCGQCGFAFLAPNLLRADLIELSAAMRTRRDGASQDIEAPGRWPTWSGWRP